MPRPTAWIPKMAYTILTVEYPEIKMLEDRLWGDIGAQRKIAATKKVIRCFQTIERALMVRGSTYVSGYAFMENYRIRESIRSALRSLSKALGLPRRL